MPNSAIPFLLLFFLFVGVAWTDETPNQEAIHVFVAKVDHVVDGDSLVVNYQGEKITIRIEGIDAPELFQPFGKQAKAALAKALPIGAEVVIEDITRGKYGRMLANVHNRKYSPGPINMSLVKDGYVWHFAKYNKSKVLAAAQKLARSSKRGLWASQHKSIAPWKYREQKDRGEIMQPKTVHKPSTKYEQQRKKSRHGYWLNLPSHQRHLVACKHADHARGTPCKSDEGAVCGVCLKRRDSTQ